MQFIENRTFDEINIGDSADLTRTLRHEDIELFAVMSGDVNPAHVDEDFAKSDMFHKVIAHGMWGGALISVRWKIVPGPNTSCITVTGVFNLRPKTSLSSLRITKNGKTTRLQSLFQLPTP